MQDKIDEIKAAFALQLSVALERITVSVVGASVKITVEITSETEEASVALKSQVEPEVATPQAATSFLAAGGATGVSVEAVEPVTVTSTEDDGGSEEHPAKNGLIAGLVVTAVAAVIVFGLIAILLSRPLDKPGVTSRPSLPFRWSSKGSSTTVVKIQKGEESSFTDVKTAPALATNAVSNVAGTDDPVSSVAPDTDYM